MINCLNEEKIKNNHSAKNSLIELMRFLFALWVLYYHDYVPYKGDFFGQGYLAVEFFFVLSGFFLVRSMKKFIDMPTKEGLFCFVKHRFKGIAVPFLIGEVFVFIYSFAFEISYNLFFGFLWYIRDLFLAMIGIFLLRKYVKNEKLFYSILAIASIVALFGFCWIPILAWPGGPFRSIASIPIGMMVALIPPISIKKQEKTNKTAISLINIVGLIVSATGCFAIIALPDKNLVLSYVLVILGYPSLLYFSNNIKINNKFLDWLGTLSFPIYSFQCIIRVIEACGLTNNTSLFLILMAMVLLFSAMLNIHKRFIKQKANTKHQ